MTYPNYQPLVEVTRGPIVESIHCGAIAVVDARGRVLASAGDPEIVTYPRSTAKPIQVLPFVELGGPRHFSLNERELAILCASHSGTDDHFNVVSGIQAKIGVSERDLLCGVHDPMDKPTAIALRKRGEEPTPNRHNCSGKHTGMLAQAMLRGLPKEEYIDPRHPVQQLIIKVFGEMTDMPVEQIGIGIDGCSVPVFALPLHNMALAFARLADPSSLAPERAAACRQITHAMMAHPDMVAGPGRFEVRHSLDPKVYATAVTLEFELKGAAPREVRSNGKLIPERPPMPADRWDREYYRIEGGRLFVTVRPNTTLEMK